MRALVYLLLLGVFTLAAIWLVPYLPGYVLVRIGGWALETSVLALIVLVILAYFAISGAVWLWRLPGNGVRNFLKRRAEAQLELGMLALAEGNWNKAEKALRKSAQNSSSPTVSYLAAAQAAHGPGAEERRARYLAQAEQRGDARLSVQVTRAQLLLSDNQPREALAILAELPDRHNRPRALEIMARCHDQLGQWTELAAIAPDLVRHGIIDADQATDLTARARREQLAEAPTFDALQTVWTALPRHDRKSPELFEARARRALELGQGAALETEVRKFLSRHWSESLCRLYGSIEGGDVHARLKAAEGWRASHGDSGALDYTLGRLCIQAELWEKAREYLQMSVDRDHRPETIAAMGDLHLKLGNAEAAIADYRSALRHALQLPSLPVVVHQRSESAAASASESSSS